MISEEVVVNDIRLHYAHAGQGPPALLLHGYGHAYTMWERPLNAYLKEKYHCYALDLPGHGASDKPPLEWYTIENFRQTIYQFCRRLDLDELLLIGYSMGGLLAMDLALSYPNLVTNLVIINSPLKGDFIAGFDPLLHLEHLAKLAVVEGFLKIYTHFHLLALPIESRRYAHFRMLFSQSCRRVQRELAQCTVQSLFGCYKMVRRADLSQQIADLQPPILVIVSDQDNVVPPHQAQLICEQVEQAHLARISGSGHLPLDEQPDLFDAALKDYLTIRKESSLE